MIVNELLKSLKKYSFYIVICIFLLLEILVAFFVLPSVVNTINDNRSKLKILNSEIADFTGIINSLASMDVNNLSSNLQKASAALPDEKKTAGLVTGLTNLASTSGVLVKSLEFAPGLISTDAASLKILQNPGEDVIKGGGIKAVNASMVVIGDLNSLIDFLTKINKASQLLGISNLNFGSQTGDNKQSSIEFYILYQPTKESSVLLKQVTPLTETENKVLESLSNEDIFILQ